MTRKQRHKPGSRHPRTKPETRRPGAARQLRIIGGQWRRRHLPVVDVPGLRPTPDRVRETLFNWLQMQVPGTRCLDLFAGSGALGFEALSREAATVVMIEQHAAAFAQLKMNIATLQTDRAELLSGDALALLPTLEPSFDLVFIDPPYRQGLAAQALDLILKHRLLTPDGLIYLEYETELTLDFGHWGLEVFRHAAAGQVMSTLLKSASPLL